MAGAAGSATGPCAPIERGDSAGEVAIAKSHRFYASDPTTAGPDFDPSNPLGTEPPIETAPSISNPVASIAQPTSAGQQPQAGPPGNLAALAKAVADAFAPPTADGMRPAGAPVPIDDPVGALINLANLAQTHGQFLNGAPPSAADLAMPPLPVVAAFLAALQDPALATMFLSGAAPAGLGDNPSRLAPGNLGPNLRPDPGLAFLIALHDGNGSAMNNGPIPAP
ncbi:MAG: hypothetical protein NVSMB18_04090 [Acetobacteraceae bacterium]